MNIKGENYTISPVQAMQVGQLEDREMVVMHSWTIGEALVCPIIQYHIIAALWEVRTSLYQRATKLSGMDHFVTPLNETNLSMSVFLVLWRPLGWKKRGRWGIYCALWIKSHRDRMIQNKHGSKSLELDNSYPWFLGY